MPRKPPIRGRCATLVLAWALLACGAQPLRPEATEVEIPLAPPAAPLASESAPVVTAPRRLPVKPSVDSPPADDTVFTVVLFHDGTFLADGQMVSSLDALQERAVIAHARNANVKALLQVDQKVVYRRVVEVLDRLRQASILDVALGVAPKKP